MVEGVHFLAHHGVFAFFCKYCDKKCTPGAIHQWMRGGWLVSWYVRLNFNTNWYWMKLSFVASIHPIQNITATNQRFVTFLSKNYNEFLVLKGAIFTNTDLTEYVWRKNEKSWLKKTNIDTGRNNLAEYWLDWT